MNLASKIAFFTVVLLFCGTTVCSAAEINKITYISAASVITPDTMEGFYAGFTAAFIEEYGMEATLKLVEKKLDYSNDPLAIQRIANAAIADGASALVGFPSSHETLLIADLCKKNDMLCLSIGARVPKVEEYGPNLHTIARKTTDDLNKMLRYISANHPQKNGAIINNAEAVYSNQITETLEQLSVGYPNLHWKRLSLDQGQKMSPNDLTDIKKFDFVFLSMFPWEGISTLTQLADQGYKGSIFATSSWDMKFFHIMQEPLSRLKTSMVLPVFWRPGSTESKDFEAAIHSIYNGPVISELALGYDAGRLMIEILQHKKERKDRTQIMKYVRTHSVCTKKSSAGKICLSKNGGYVERKSIFARLNSSGFTYFEIN